MKKLYAIEYWSDCGGKGKNYSSTMEFIESSKFPHEKIFHESEMDDGTIYEKGCKVHEVNVEFLDSLQRYVTFYYKDSRDATIRYCNYGEVPERLWSMTDVRERVESTLYWIERFVNKCSIFQKYPNFSIGENDKMNVKVYEYSLDMKDGRIRSDHKRGETGVEYEMNSSIKKESKKYALRRAKDLAEELFELGFTTKECNGNVQLESREGIGINVLEEISNPL